MYQFFSSDQYTCSTSTVGPTGGSTAHHSLEEECSGYNCTVLVKVDRIYLKRELNEYKKIHQQKVNILFSFKILNIMICLTCLGDHHGSCCLASILDAVGQGIVSSCLLL